MGVGPPKDREAVLLAVEPTAHKASTTRVARRDVFIGEGLLQQFFFIQFYVAFSAGQDYSKCGIWLSDLRTGLYGRLPEKLELKIWILSSCKEYRAKNQ